MQLIALRRHGGFCPAFRVVFGMVCLGATLAASNVWAQSDCFIDKYGTRACPVGPGPGGPPNTGNGDPLPVPVGPSFDDRRRSYQSIVDYLTQGGSQAARRMARDPATGAELSTALASFELELLREISRLKYDLSRHQKEQGELAELIPAKTAELRNMRAYLPELRAQVEASTAETARVTQDIAVWDSRGADVYRRAKLVEERLRVSQKAAISLLNALTPKDRLVAGPRVVDASPGLVGPRSQRQPAPVVLPIDLRPGASPAALNVSYPPAYISSAPAGSDDQRLKRLGDLGSVFDAVSQHDRQSVEVILAKRPVLENLLQQLSDTEALIAVASREKKNAEFDAESAQKKLLASKGSYLDSRRELVKVASVEWAWKAWRTKVVLPAVHSFASANGLDQFLEPVGTGNNAWYRVKDLNIERDFPASLKNWSSFFKVQQETLALLDDPGRFVNHAAQLAAFGSPAEMKRYAEDLYRGLDEKGVRLAKAAGRVKVPGGTQAFAAKLFDWSRDEKNEYELQ